MGEWDNSRMHDPAYMAERIASCEAEIAKGIVGQREIIRQVLLAMLTGGNVLLEGMPGLGKCWSVRLAKFLTCHLNEYSLRRI